MMKKVFLITINPFVIKEKYQYTTKKDIVFLRTEDELIFQDPQITGIRTMYCGTTVAKDNSNNFSLCLQRVESFLINEKVKTIYVFVHQKDHQKMYELLRPVVIASGNRFYSPGVTKETLLQKGSLFSITHEPVNNQGIRPIGFYTIEDEIYSVVEPKISMFRQQITQSITVLHDVLTLCLN